MSIQRIRISYSNGDVYEGESDCKKNGQGNMRYSDGQVYPDIPAEINNFDKYGGSKTNKHKRKTNKKK
jgi:hypothetical protein